MFNPTQFYEYGKQRKVFESTWKTDNTSAGSSATNQVKLPLMSTGTYAMTVNWGDGTSDRITIWNQATATHTYSVVGTYDIKITGTCIGWSFGNTGDRLKILSVKEWGVLRFTVSSAFRGCANIDLSLTTDTPNFSLATSLNLNFAECTNITTINKLSEWDISTITLLSGCFSSNTNFNGIGVESWNVSNVINFDSMFAACTSFNRNIGGWNVSNGQTFNAMFRVCTSFNQNLGSWVMTSATDLGEQFGTSSGMFNGCTVFNNGGSDSIKNWDVSNVTDFGNMFANCPAFNQPLNWNVSKGTMFFNMFNGATSFNNGLASGISGTLPWTINTTSSVNMTSMFQSATSFNQTLPWDMSKVTTIQTMFNGANKFNGVLSGWNLPICTNFASTFNNASIFNNGLASGVAGNMFWTNTSAVTTANLMFNNAGAFNQNLGVLNLSGCSDLSQMFSGAIGFNNGGSDSIKDWVIRTAGAVNMLRMFSTDNSSPSGNPVFNQPLTNWDVSAVTNMSYMFGTFQGVRVSPFNNGLALGVAGTWTWNTSNVTNMSYMFNSCRNFNQDVGSWNVSACGNFTAMFANCSVFNNGGSSSINSWTLKITGTINMTSMFQDAVVFNQPIGSWNTIAVTNMNAMFSKIGGSGNMSFNQPIGGWNVSNVTDMGSMFNISSNSISVHSNFNQNIGAWNISNVTDFTNFMNNKQEVDFSTANLDAIYNGWSTRPVKPSIVIKFGAAKYTAGASAGRAILTGAPNLWTIIDGGI